MPCYFTLCSTHYVYFTDFIWPNSALAKQKKWLCPKISTDLAANLMLNTWTGAYYLKEELFTVSSQLHYQGFGKLWLAQVG